MNGLPLTLTVAAVAVLLGCLAGLAVGYRADRRTTSQNRTEQ